MSSPIERKKQGVSIKEILELDLSLELLNPGADLSHRITDIEVNRPGLALTGFFEYFAYRRIQVFGKGEWAYLRSLEEEALRKSLERFFDYDLTCLVFTYGHKPPPLFLEFAQRKRVPVLKTLLPTQEFIGKLAYSLEEKLAPSMIFHGVLVEVFGVGVLLEGKSGVGKSETALELVERGHRLVADDVVEIVRKAGAKLYGYASPIIEHHMEIRGLGIINIRDLYGAGSVRKSKRIDLLIQLEDWDESKEYDRLGLEENTKEILGVKIPYIVLPVRPGRNVPILIETAAKNLRLKAMGIHPAKELNERLLEYMRGKNEEEEG